LDVPVGKVRFYDAEKGFGFLTKDEGGDVYVRANALPPGVTSLKAGQRVEFGVVEGRKGEQALSVHVLEVPPSLSKAHRKPPEQMTVIIEDLIKMLDGIGNGYRRGRHPDAKTSTKIATVLRAVAGALALDPPALWPIAADPGDVAARSRLFVRTSVKTAFAATTRGVVWAHKRQDGPRSGRIQRDVCAQASPNVIAV
jgi:cold shock protein